MTLCIYLVILAMGLCLYGQLFDFSKEVYSCYTNDRRMKMMFKQIDFELKDLIKETEQFLKSAPRKVSITAYCCIPYTLHKGLVYKLQRVDTVDMHCNTQTIKELWDRVLLVRFWVEIDILLS